MAASVALQSPRCLWRLLNTLGCTSKTALTFTGGAAAALCFALCCEFTAVIVLVGWLPAAGTRAPVIHWRSTTLASSARAARLTFSAEHSCVRRHMTTGPSLE